MPGRDAALAEEGGLLVAEHPGDRHAVESRAARRRDGAEDAVGGDDLGQQRRRRRRRARTARRDHSRVAEVVAARCARRSTASVSSAPPSAPPVRCQQTSVSTVHERRVARGVERPGVEEPAHLGRREVRVEDEPGELAHARLGPGRGESRALGGGAPVLPDDRRGGRAPVRAVERDRRLALVGDPERDGVSPRSRAAAATSPSASSTRRRISLGVVLDPPGRRGSDCGELAVADVEDAPVGGRQARARTPGGAGVHGDEALHGEAPIRPRPSDGAAAAPGAQRRAGPEAQERGVTGSE